MEYKLNYDITKEDYYDFNDTHIKKSKSGTFLHIACSVFIALCTVWIIVLQFYSEHFSFVSVIPVAVLVYVLFGRKLFRKKYITKVYESNKKLHQNIELTVDESKISEKNDVSSMVLNKDDCSITDVVEGKNGIYIYFSKIQSFLIPSHAFATSKEYTSFVEFVKANYTNEKVKFIQCEKTAVRQIILAVLTGTAVFGLYFWFVLH